MFFLRTGIVPSIILLLCTLSSATASPLVQLQQRATEHPDSTGVYVLERGEESLLARAWLTEQAQKRIDVQYFIWSTDNIGTLASEFLLRAAERGVSVRVIVDDLMVDAEPQTLLALAAHPKVEIRIYNPLHSVGTSTPSRLWNLLTDFRAANQRMHDKTVLFDGSVGITGGRNMADEYYDYNQRYNFRDRDVMLVGRAAGEMGRSFERFWKSPFSVPVESLLEAGEIADERTVAAYRRWLHDYAADPENFEPEVRRALASMDDGFAEMVRRLEWCDVRFISDAPGKNSGEQGLAGGGRTTDELVKLVAGAKHRVTIQTPYLVMPPGGIELFRELVERGVKVRIVTNSLASTDNLQAFSGYAKQRRELVEAGVAIHEFKPRPAIRTALIQRYKKLQRNAPIFAVHAKTLVIDSQRLFVGTFNLDPRSANLNTEVGALIDSPRLARQVEEVLEREMHPENSWRVGDEEGADSHASWGKRLRLWWWSLWPLEPLL